MIGAVEAAAAPAQPAASPVAPAEEAPAVAEVPVAKGAEPPAAEPSPAEPPPAESPAAEPPPAEPSPEPPAPQQGDGVAALFEISLTDASMTNRIEDRMPVEVRERWVIGEDPEVLVWMEFENAGESVTVTTIWKKDGEERWRLDVNVGRSKNWRTWVKKRIGKRDAGPWTVEIVDEGGFVYGRRAFEIVEGT